MPEAVGSIASALEQLGEQLQSLERRVAALEVHVAEAAPAATDTTSIPIERPRPPATWRGFPPVEGSSKAVPIMGKAVLGIAGAYLLRALSESGSIPKLPILFIAISYACFWMIWAARAYGASRFASVTYALTSALIFCPLMWESTVRFKVLSPAFASFWLVTFAVIAIAIARRGDLQLIPWIAILSSLGTAVVLMVASRDLVPLAIAVLAVAFAVESVGCLRQRLTVRGIPALAAGFAVWLLVYVLTSFEGVPEGYRAADPRIMTALSLSLMIVYGGSIAHSAFVARREISLLQLLEAVMAFGVGSFGVLRSAHGNLAPELGISFLVLAAGCYWGVLASFAGDAEKRNRLVAATWAPALAIAGTFLLFSENWRASFLCLCAVAAALVYARTGKFSLGLHASIYIAIAAPSSPMVKYVANALSGAVPAAPDRQTLIVGLAAVLCYGIGSRRVEAERRRRLLWMVPVLLVGFSVTALAVVAVVGVSGGRVDFQASILSVVRTIANCALALMFGFSGSRLKRPELVWSAYAAVGFGTIKLLFEDLRFGNAASLVVSLLFYGLILIVLPRLAGRSREVPQ